jgi:hypothetical protein
LTLYHFLTDLLDNYEQISTDEQIKSFEKLVSEFLAQPFHIWEKQINESFFILCNTILEKHKENEQITLPLLSMVFQIGKRTITEGYSIGLEAIGKLQSTLSEMCSSPPTPLCLSRSVPVVAALCLMVLRGEYDVCPLPQWFLDLFCDEVSQPPSEWDCDLMDDIAFGLRLSIRGLFPFSFFFSFLSFTFLLILFLFSKHDMLFRVGKETEDRRIDRKSFIVNSYENILHTYTPTLHAESAILLVLDSLFTIAEEHWPFFRRSDGCDYILWE